MTAKLVVVGGAKRATIRLKRLPATMGRGSEASLKVGDTLVSRKHCEIYEEDGRLMVRDLDSANGTFVNKHRIDQPTQLTSGDLLKVGPVILKAVCEEVAPPAEDSFIDLADVAEEAVADPAAASASQSRVEYSETPDGSFIGIRDDEMQAFEEPEQVAEQPAAPATPAEPDDLLEDLTSAGTFDEPDDVAAQAETLPDLADEPAEPDVVAADVTADVPEDVPEDVIGDEPVETVEEEAEMLEEIGEEEEFGEDEELVDEEAIDEKEELDQQEAEPAEIEPSVDAVQQPAQDEKEKEKEKDAPADALADLDLDDAPQKDISSEDSALNDFFKNL